MVSESSDTPCHRLGLYTGLLASCQVDVLDSDRIEVLLQKGSTPGISLAPRAKVVSLFWEPVPVAEPTP